MKLFVLFFLATIISTPINAMSVCIENRQAANLYGDPGQENSQYPGVYFEVLKRLQNNLQVEYEIQRMPFRSCLKLLSLGKIDAIMAVSYSKEREEIAVFPPKSGALPDVSYSVSQSRYFLYSFSDVDIAWDGDHKSLKPYKIGALQNYSIVGDLGERGVTIDESRDFITLLRKLEVKRIDGIAAHEVPAKYHNYQLKKYEPELFPKQYFVIFSKQFYAQRKTLVESIWQYIKKLNAKGEIKNLYQSYQDRAEH